MASTKSSTVESKPPGQEVGEGGGADDAPFFGEGDKGFLILVAPVAAEGAGVGVGDGDRLLGDLDGVKRRLRADVRQVDDDSEPVHFAHRVDAEVAEACVVPLPATAAEQVGLVVGHLDHPHPEGEEDPEAVEVVLYRRGVLETEDYPGPAELLGGVDVGGLLHLQDVVALAKAPHPGRQVGHGLQEVLPRRHRGVDGGDVAGPQPLEHGVALPVADVETVYHDRLVVDPPRFARHQSAPFSNLVPIRNRSPKRFSLSSRASAITGPIEPPNLKPWPQPQPAISTL